MERALEIIHENDLTLVDKLADDPLVSNLLILHGLHPLDLEARVRNRKNYRSARDSTGINADKREPIALLCDFKGNATAHQKNMSIERK